MEDFTGKKKRSIFYLWPQSGTLREPYQQSIFPHNVGYLYTLDLDVVRGGGGERAFEPKGVHFKRLLSLFHFTLAFVFLACVPYANFKVARVVVPNFLIPWSALGFLHRKWSRVQNGCCRGDCRMSRSEVMHHCSSKIQHFRQKLCWAGCLLSAQPVQSPAGQMPRLAPPVF